MSRNGESNIFWVSFSDLMTSLFFIVLILFVVTYVNNLNEIKAKEEQLKVYKEVEESLKPLKQDSLLFIYEEEYKRFLLSFDVKFYVGKAGITPTDLENYDVTQKKILDAGAKLQMVLDKIVVDAMQQNENGLAKVTYLVVISGYASKLESADLSSKGVYAEYVLSYSRAYSLWDFWKKYMVDFEASKYKGLIDLQLAGNGWGGVGRAPLEGDNQRFIVQVIPKISNQNLSN